MKTRIQSVKGTRDFYPQQMEIRNWLYSKIKEVSSSYGYQEWDGPFLEKIDLYAAKSGEELVKEQAFVFPDRSGEMITLRPELTLSLARMVAEKQNELIFPLRWWSFGPFWRYERPQKGRTREFFQWNADMIGVDSPEADAELISICASFFKKTGFTSDEVKIFINHRQLMDQELVALGISSSLKKEVFKLIDRRDKMKKEDWEVTALEAGLTKDQLMGLISLLENKELWKHSPELVRVFSTLKELGIDEYVEYNPQIIRGLDYYTGTVFEACDMGAEGRAVLGGGHYSNLVGDVGGNPVAGVGFAMGDVMATLLLEKYNKLPDFRPFENCVLVTVFDQSLLLESTQFASQIRNAGMKTICYPEATKLQKQFKYADRLGIQKVVVIGPDEAASGKVTIKNLEDGSQEIVEKDLAIKKLIEMLA